MVQWVVRFSALSGLKDELKKKTLFYFVKPNFKVGQAFCNSFVNNFGSWKENEVAGFVVFSQLQ